METYSYTSSEVTNFARLSNALLQICANLLRETLQRTLPSWHKTLNDAIAANKNNLKKFVNEEQRALLFPPNGAVFSGSAGDFDISLLYILIRNISNTKGHINGWGNVPRDQPRDSSISANVERTRLLRNKISGHSVTGMVSDTDFRNIWSEIEVIVQELETSLKLSGFTESLEKLKTQDMDPQSTRKAVEKFAERLPTIEARQEDIRTEQVSQRQELMDIQEKTERLQSIEARQVDIKNEQTSHTKELGDIKENTKRLPSIEARQVDIKNEQTSQRNELVDIKENTVRIPNVEARQEDIKSEQVSQRKELVDIKERTERLPKIEANQVEIKVEQVSQRKELLDIKEKAEAMHGKIDDLSRSKTENADERTPLIDKPQGRNGRFRRRAFPCCCCVFAQENSEFNLQRTKERLINLYKKDYRFIPKNPFDPKSGTAIQSVYTELEIEDFHTGDKIQTLKTEDFANLIQMPVGRKRAKRIALEGKAGSGKTVYACKLITDWCEVCLDYTNRDYLTDFDICLPVSLHSIQNITTLRSLLQMLLGSNADINTELLADFIQNNQERVLIVMDGLDEYRDNCSIINDIIQNKVLQDCVVVVTSRPWKLQDIPDRVVDRKAKILGFSEENTKLYVERVFQHIFAQTKTNAEQTAQGLIVEIQNKKLVDISKLPLILLFMCYLWDYYKQLPEYETDIYINVIKCLVGNYKAKRKSVQKLENVKLEGNKTLFLTLGKVALHGRSSENTASELIFDEEVLKTTFPPKHIDEALRIGLLSKQNNFSIVKTRSHLSFPHKSIQEFFVAYLFVHSKDKATRTLLQTSLEKLESAENFENVLKFIAGIDQNRSISSDVFRHLATEFNQSYKHRNDFCRYLTLIFKMGREVKSGIGIDFFKESLVVEMKPCFMCYKVHILPHNWRALFTSLSNATNIESIIIEYCLDMCGSQVEIPYLPALTVMKIVSVKMVPHDWKVLFSSLSNALNLRTIEIDKCSNMRESQVQMPSLPKLEMITFQGVEMTAADWESFFMFFKNCGMPDFVNIMNCPGVANCQIEVNKLLVRHHRFSLSRVNMPPHGWRALFFSLENNDDLFEIDISNCQNLASSRLHVPSLPALKSLTLCYVTIEPQDWEVLIMSLCNAPNLETISIEECSGLCNSHIKLPSLPALKTFIFQGVQMTDADWESFFMLFQNNSRPENITIRKCHGVNDCQIEPKKLQVRDQQLVLSHIEMPPVSWRMLFDSLKNYNDLVNIHISDCESFAGSRLQVPSLPLLKTITFQAVEMTDLDWESFFTLFQSSSRPDTITIKNCPNIANCHIDVNKLKVRHQYLVLECVEMPPYAWKMLFLSLKNNPDLVEIYVSSCGNLTGSQVQIPLLSALKTLKFCGVTMNPLDWNVFFKSFSNAPNLETISIERDSDMCESNVQIPSLFAVKQLKCFGVTMNPQDWRGLFTSLSNSQNPQTINNEDSDITDKLAQVPSLQALTTLKFNGIHMTPQDWRVLFKSLSNAPNLETIHFEECSDMCNSQVQVPSLLALTTLTFVRVQMKQHDWGFFFTSLETALNLKTFHIELCSDMRYSQVEVPALPALKALTFDGVTMKPQDWSILFASLSNAPNLESIVIVCCTDMCDSQIEIPELQRLQTVYFCQLEMFPTEWKELVQSLKNSSLLKSLSIKSCRGWEGSKTQLPLLPNLTKLDITGTLMSEEDKSVLSKLNANMLSITFESNTNAETKHIHEA